MSLSFSVATAKLLLFEDLLSSLSSLACVIFNYVPRCARFKTHSLGRTKELLASFVFEDLNDNCAHCAREVH